jgi:hypothetical protein
MVVLLATDLMVTGMLEGIARRHAQPIVSISPAAIGKVELPESPRLALIDLNGVADIASLVPQLRAQFGDGCQLVAFAPHVHVDRIKAARQAGCDRVITRGQLQEVAEELMAG